MKVTIIIIKLSSNLSKRLSLSSSSQCHWLKLCPLLMTRPERNRSSSCSSRWTLLWGCPSSSSRTLLWFSLLKTKRCCNSITRWWATQPSLRLSTQSYSITTTSTARSKTRRPSKCKRCKIISGLQTKTTEARPTSTTIWTIAITAKTFTIWEISWSRSPMKKNQCWMHPDRISTWTGRHFLPTIKMVTISSEARRFSEATCQQCLKVATVCSPLASKTELHLSFTILKPWQASLKCRLSSLKMLNWVCQPWAITHCWGSLSSNRLKTVWLREVWAPIWIPSIR